MYQDLFTSKAIQNKLNKETFNPCFESKKPSSTSLYYPTSKLVENKVLSQNLAQYPDISDSRMRLNTAPTKPAPTNYQEMIDKLRMKDPEKKNLLLIKFDSKEEENSKLMERCKTEPDDSITSTKQHKKIMIPNQANKNINTFSDTKSSLLKDSKLLKLSFYDYQRDQQYDYKNKSIGINFTPKMKETDDILSVKFKQIKGTGKRIHSKPDFNSLLNNQTINKNKQEMNDLQNYKNKKSLSTFYNSNTNDDKQYTKVYDKIYAASFMYPEYDDPILEKEYHDEEYESWQKNNYSCVTLDSSSMTSDISLPGIDMSKYNIIGDFFIKNDLKKQNKTQSIILQNINKIKENESNFRLNNSTSNSISSILSSPVLKQTYQTTKNSFTSSLLQENKSYANYSTSSIHQNFSSLNIPPSTSYAPLQKTYNTQSYDYSSQIQSPTSYTTYGNSYGSSSLTNYTQTSIKPQQYTSSYVIENSKIPSLSTGNNLPAHLINYQKIDTQTYFKENSVTDYKSMTFNNSSNKQNSINLSTLSNNNYTQQSTIKQLPSSSSTLTQQYESSKLSYPFNQTPEQLIQYYTSGADRRDSSSNIYYPLTKI